jgi:RNA polymerase sigma factor (sigma-70 family)
MNEMDTFLKANERLIWLSIIRQFETQYNAERIASNHNMDLDDLLQIGRIGLWECKKNFDENKGTFSTYAVKYIRLSFMRELKRKGHLIRIPAHHDIKDYDFVFIPGDKPANDEGENIFTIISSGYDLENEVIEQMDLEQRIKKLKEVVTTLSPKDREIVIMRSRGKTLQEIGNKHGVTRKAISHKYLTLIKRMKAKIEYDYQREEVS